MRHGFLLISAALAFTAACQPTGGGLPFPAGDEVAASPQVTGLAGGWAAGRVIGTRVYGRDGEEIGVVDDLVIGPDDRVQAVVVSIDGDGGGEVSAVARRQVVVPWGDLRATPSRDSFALPVKAAESLSYPASAQVEPGAGPGPRAWRATELIGDTVELEDATGYGWVEDILFGADGSARGVLVAPSAAGTGASPGQAYAFPFHGFGPDFPPEAPAYGLSYGTAEIGAAEPFDYGMF